MPAAVDLEILLTPIPGDNPAGVDLRYEGIYDRIQEARREDEDLPQGVWTKNIVKKSDWSMVESLCVDALATQTKDLQIAVWLLEAWIIQNGVPGLKQGLELIDGFCEIFWESMYPTLDPEDPDYRLAPFRWMNEKMTLRLKQLQITEPDSADARSYRWIDWENARHLETQAMKNPQAMAELSEDKVTTAHFNASVILTPARYFMQLHNDMRESMDLLKKIEDSLDEKLGKDAPGFKNFREVLKEIINLLDDILRRLGEDPATMNNGSVESTGETVEEGGGMAVTLGSNGDGQPGMETAGGIPAIRNRADAYRVLSMVTEYLMRIEPHSPAPYLIKRAISWGSMPLSTLLQELLDGNSDLSTIYKLLGIRDVPQDNNSGW